MSDRNWLYVLSLLLPLTVYSLVLKVFSVTLQEEQVGPLDYLLLLRSDLLFNLGYAIFWVGLFAAFGRGLFRRIVTVLFHAASLLIVATVTVAHQYFEATGSTLDFGIVTFYLGTLGEVKNIIASEASWHTWAGLAVALLYVLFGPWLVVRVAGWRVREGIRRTSRLKAAALGLVAVGIGSLSLVPGTADANQAFSLSPFVNVLVTGVGGPDVVGPAPGEGSGVREALDGVRLEGTPQTEKRNVILIHLESVRARSVTPYNEDADTTPFMDELARRSLLAERAYTTTPHTSKAITSVNCGIYPHPETEIHESKPGAILVRCLAELLGEQGYRSVFFQSATETFEGRPQLVENFGYDEFYGLGDMDKEGFERAGYLGYEDNIMLHPSRRWLEEHGKAGPFLASYVTITPHHEWLAPDRYGLRDYNEEDRLNRYLNTVRYVDFFVKNLIEQYRELGLYENTLFILYGDHGEGFAEHGVRGHDNVIHEEGLRVPLIIHDPQRWQDGERIGPDVPVNHMDLPPTILDLLGYRVVNGEYPGRSVLNRPRERTLFFNCRPDLVCIASVDGYRKHIYHYGRQPDEFYNLGDDPLEKNNLASEVGAKELRERREELLEWRAKSAGTFDGVRSE